MDEVAAWLEARAGVRIWTPGALLFRQDEEAVSFFYLKSGLCQTYTTLKGGEERSIMTTWPGRFFGASSFFEGKPRRASAVAIRRSEAVEVDRALYTAACEEHPALPGLLLRALSWDVGVLFEQMADTALLSAERKVARFLCRRIAYGQYPAGEGLSLDYTQAFIARVLGLSRVAVNQALASFREEGWVETRYGRIDVLQPEPLRDYAYCE